MTLAEALRTKMMISLLEMTTGSHRPRHKRRVGHHIIDRVTLITKTDASFDDDFGFSFDNSAPQSSKTVETQITPAAKSSTTNVESNGFGDFGAKDDDFSFDSQNFASQQSESHHMTVCPSHTCRRAHLLDR